MIHKLQCSVDTYNMCRITTIQGMNCWWGAFNTDKFNVQKMPIFNVGKMYVPSSLMPSYFNVNSHMRMWIWTPSYAKSKIWYGTWRNIIHYWGHFFMCVYVRTSWEHVFVWINCCREHTNYTWCTIIWK